jgi:hypothetical protein
MPGTDLMPSGAMETFSGSNGATPSATNITTALNQGSGGSVTIQGNQCDLKTGTTQFNRTSIRITGLSVSDAEVEFTWTVLALSVAYCGFYLRANSPIDSGHGYLFSLEPNDMTVTRHNPTATYAGPDLVTNTHGFTAGQVVKTRVALFGNVIRVRTWLASNSEPTSVWQIIYTDPSGSGGFTTAGSVGWTVSSASAGSKDFLIDSIDIHNAITPSQATLAATGGITPGGVLTKIPAKKFTGAMTPAGAFAKTRVVLKAMAGAITPTGLLAKIPQKALAGNVTPAGILVRRPNKKFAGVIAPAAALKRAYIKRFTGAITPAGVGVVLGVGRIFGRPGIVVMSLIQRAEVRIRHRKG